MIIQCLKCNKKFDVDSNLIPSSGRSIQCGSCNYIWFFKKDHNISTKIPITIPEGPEIKESINVTTKINSDKSTKKSYENFNEIKSKNKKNQIPKKIDSKSNFSLGKFLSYIIVIIISFIAFVIVLDTFKSLLYVYFPNLEFLLFSFFETLKDIQLFIKDLN